MRPIQNCQYCGVMADEPVLHQLEHDRADQAAIEIAGAADDQHQQHVGRALEVEHVERDELRRLRQQRAGDAGVDRRRACRPRPAAPSRGCRSRGRAADCRVSRTQRQPERRMDDAPREQEQDEQHDEAVGVGGAAEEVEVEDGPSTGSIDDALQAVGAAGEPVELVGELDAGSARRRASPSGASGRCRAAPGSW